MSPDDPRMRMIESASWLCILRVLGNVERDKNAHEVNPTLDRVAADSVWEILGATELKSQVQELYRTR